MLGVQLATSQQATVHLFHDALFQSIIIYPPILYLTIMSHTIRDKQKLLNRVRRIRGQVDAIERALIDEGDCVSLLQQITSCRGAMNGLLGVVLEDHIRSHLVDIDDAGDSKEVGKEQLIEIVRSYFNEARHERTI